MDIPKSSKIVYLDQNAWIELGKFREGQKSSCDEKLFETVMQTSNNGTALFPMSFSHLLEITNTAKTEWRKELLSLIVEISHYYTFTHWTNLRELEIKNLVFKELGLPLIDVRSYLVGKGFSNLMGATPTVKSEKISPEMLKELNQKLLLALNNPEIFLEYAQKIYKDHKSEDIPAIQEFERIREELKNQFKDYQYRRKVFLCRNIVATILPKLGSFLYELNLPSSFSQRIFDKFDADEFLSKLPTALCEFTLLFQRDELPKRPIQVNDLYDVWHLTLAIPYCDIVVTEKTWTTIAKQAKLDEICNTVILSSIHDLKKYL
jgi:hypothetical protein